MIGKTISHYQITEKIGTGGMGVVYKATDTRLKRIVALKFLPQDLTRDEQAKQRFMHEAQTASALQSSNICTIHDIDETAEGQLFICMDYYSGDTLKEKLEHGALSVSDAIKIALAIARGLAAAHKADVIHRDIKPANIMITDENEIKILDFGLAKLSSQTQLTMEGSTLGTISYMSPEQAAGTEVDSRTDIWSLGVVLYEMLSGQSPFRGEFDQAIIYSIMNEDPLPLSQQISDLPENIEYVITKMLAKNQQERYQTINELIDDLTAMQEGSEISKRSSIARVHLPKKRKVVWMSGFFIICLAVLIILFYPSQTIPFSERDWILITDFENLTEETIFDKSLNTALSISIDQSQYVNVFSRRRMLETLVRMQKAGQKQIDEETGREIALREGINIYVAPSISKVGNQYALMSKIQEATTGNTLQSEIFYAAGHDEILSKMDELSENIRKNLGESRFDIQRQNKRLARVTTSSLEALKQYSLGIENHVKTNFEQARICYQNALEIDTGFVAAKASLGNILLEQFDREQGSVLISEAVKQVDNLTDKEKYGILAFHAVNVQHDLQKGIEYMKTGSALYPDDSAIRNNLGWYYQLSGNYKQSIEEYKEAIRINPYFMLTYGGILWTYLQYIGDMDSAYVWSKKMLNINPDNSWANFYFGCTFVGMDSLDKAEKYLQRSWELNLPILTGIYRLVHVHRIKGNYNEAIKILTSVLEMKPNEVPANYDIGIMYEALNKKNLAYKNFSKYLTLAKERFHQNPNDASAAISLAITHVHMDQNTEARRLADLAMNMDSTLYLRYAEFYALEGNKDAAFDQLEKLLAGGYRDLVWLKLNPELTSLHSDERFDQILKRYFN
jgi:serine/threonine protein kinase/Tfp pilus assembly protein PilF